MAAWIAAQESETLVTIRNQLSRIFDTEHGGTLSPHAQTFKVFRMHNRTVKLLGLNIKKVAAKQKTIVCRMSSDTRAHWRNVYF